MALSEKRWLLTVAKTITNSSSNNSSSGSNNTRQSFSSNNKITTIITATEQSNINANTKPSPANT